MSKPFSQACENNKAAILSVISEYFNDEIQVLEIGTYTAQHVRFFAENLPRVSWQPTDTPDNLPIVQAGLEDNALLNIKSPLALDVCQQEWPLQKYEGIFSANTLHIMPEASVACFFRGAGKALALGGYLCVYGPFKYEGEFTSASNAQFEHWLKDRDPASGIRDFETVNGLAEQQNLSLIKDHAMPANNQLLVWQK